VFRVYLVGDRSICGPDHVAGALAGLPRGAAAVQLRDKDAGSRELLALARALLPVCAAHGAPLLVNDRADVALATGAGVHLPAAGLPPAEARRLLGPGALIGVSCHSLPELRAAGREGADFAVYGPIWPTPGKGPRGLGVQALGEAAREVRLPVFALGGVDASNAADALRAGASGVACIRAVLGAADPRRAAQELWRAMEAA
jgi:thiamine-phosphate pyrophosphorylase